LDAFTELAYHHLKIFEDTGSQQIFGVALSYSWKNIRLDKTKKYFVWVL